MSILLLEYLMKIYIVLINAAVVALKDESVLSYDCSSNLINNNNFSTNQNQGRQNSNDLFSNSEHLESNLATFHIIIYFYIQYLGAYPSESYIHLLYRLYMGEFGSPGYAPTTLQFLHNCSQCSFRLMYPHKIKCMT